MRNTTGVIVEYKQLPDHCDPICETSELVNTQQRCNNAVRLSTWEGGSNGKHSNVWVKSSSSKVCIVFVWRNFEGAKRTKHTT